MNSVKRTYQLAINEFLTYFDTHWKGTVEKIGIDNSQLSEGSRLRPQICMWGYLSTIEPDRVLSSDYSKIANIAVSIELIHKASLILDDWLDNDTKRHGVSTFHVEHGAQKAVMYAINLIGVSLTRLENVFSDAIVLPHNYYLCLNTLIKTIQAMAKGALQELLLDNDIFDSNKIHEIIQLETAEIISNSLLLGYYAGVENSVDRSIEYEFKRIGDQCGYLFQVLNDLEAFSNPDRLIAHKGSLNYDYGVSRKNMAVATLFEVASQKDQELLYNADTFALLQKMKEYHVIETIQTTAKAIFRSIFNIKEIRSRTPLSAEWCVGFQSFLNFIKETAELRLKA